MAGDRGCLRLNLAGRGQISLLLNIDIIVVVVVAVVVVVMMNSNGWGHLRRDLAGRGSLLA